MTELIAALWPHVPYLAGGFLTNLQMSVLAMGLGTVIGVGLGRWRFSGRLGGGHLGGFGTNVCRNVPSFVLLFYMASMFPAEIKVGAEFWPVPQWIKATVALTFPVIGFASDQSRGYFAQARAGTSGAFETFAIAWLQYFLIIIMASATASVIGADEIVGRANTLIAAESRDGFLLQIYVFVSLWFLATGLVFSVILKGLLRHNASRANV